MATEETKRVGQARQALAKGMKLTAAEKALIERYDAEQALIAAHEAEFEMGL